MESHGATLSIIFSGVPLDVDRFLAGSEEIAMRLQRKMVFPDLSVEELQDAFVRMLDGRGLTVDPAIISTIRPFISRIAAGVIPAPM